MFRMDPTKVNHIYDNMVNISKIFCPIQNKCSLYISRWHPPPRISDRSDTGQFLVAVYVGRHGDLQWKPDRIPHRYYPKAAIYDHRRHVTPDPIYMGNVRRNLPGLYPRGNSEYVT